MTAQGRSRRTQTTSRVFQVLFDRNFVGLLRSEAAVFNRKREKAPIQYIFKKKKRSEADSSADPLPDSGSSSYQGWVDDDLPHEASVDSEELALEPSGKERTPNC